MWRAGPWTELQWEVSPTQTFTSAQPGPLGGRSLLETVLLKVVDSHAPPPPPQPLVPWVMMGKAPIWVLGSL